MRPWPAAELAEKSASAALRALELYCGIGGCSTALSRRAQIVAAVDINALALEVFGRNHSAPVRTGLCDSLTNSWLAEQRADLWWASPPCQPFTRRGLRRDLEDPRAATLKVLLRQLEAVRPLYLGFENVVGFETSQAHAELLRTLNKAGYSSILERVLCPTELGWPNQRPRYYLVASRGALASLPSASGEMRPLADFLDSAPDPNLRLTEDIERRYRGALHVVDPNQRDAVSTCFTSAYGRSPVRSGSYVALPDGGVRRFSPAEVLRLLGFPADFTLPPELPLTNAWRLTGNSLSIPAVRFMLSAVGPLSNLRTDLRTDRGPELEREVHGP